MSEKEIKSFEVYGAVCRIRGRFALRSSSEKDFYRAKQSAINDLKRQINIIETITPDHFFKEIEKNIHFTEK